MLHILLIEDNPADVLLIREAIRTSTVQGDVLIAHDGRQGLRMLTEFQFKPDFVLLDLNLPKFSGLQILERYRAKEGPPVVVFTSSQNPADQARALALGARQYIVKSSDLAAYMQSIQDALRHWLPDTAEASGTYRSP